MKNVDSLLFPRCQKDHTIAGGQGTYRCLKRATITIRRVQYCNKCADDVKCRARDIVPIIDGNHLYDMSKSGLISIIRQLHNELRGQDGHTAEVSSDLRTTDRVKSKNTRA